jgi:hypothetical protein
LRSVLGGVRLGRQHRLVRPEGKQYGTKPGFYLMVGPDWEGEVPAGIGGVFRSPTNMAAFCPRRS